MVVDKAKLMVDELNSELEKQGIKPSLTIEASGDQIVILSISEDRNIIINIYEDKHYYELYLEVKEDGLFKNIFYTRMENAKGAVDYTIKIIKNFS